MDFVAITAGFKRGFFERRGREGFAEGAKVGSKVSGLVSYARLGVYHPLCRPTRNQRLFKPVAIDQHSSDTL